MPKWQENFSDLVTNNWYHHAPCEHIDARFEFDKISKVWIIEVYPVVQEIYGGELDGKKTWAGFEFNIQNFLNAKGIWVKDIEMHSYCKECSDHPSLIIFGKYFGRNFGLKIHLEPEKESKPVEILDSINNKIKDA